MTAKLWFRRNWLNTVLGLIALVVLAASAVMAAIGLARSQPMFLTQARGFALEGAGVAVLALASGYFLNAFRAARDRG